MVNTLIPGSTGKDTEKAYHSIYPPHDVFIRKLNMLKRPKFELSKLMDLHDEGSGPRKAIGDETSVKVYKLMDMKYQCW